MYVADVRAKLQLDDSQVVQLEQILDETGAKVRQNWMDYHKLNDAVHDEQVARITAMLRPEQRPLYDKFRADRDAQMKRDRDRGGRGGPGHGGPPPGR